MEFRRPLQVVTPTLDGDVLAVLARTDTSLTGRQVHRLVGHSSEEGVCRALARLVRQGIVGREQAGRAHLYRLNRDHLAARWIEHLAGLQLELVDRLRETIAGWYVQPVAAALFGSVARGEAGPDSDLDLLVVRPAGCDPDDRGWRGQVETLAASATAWTGNDARVLEYGKEELGRACREHVLDEAARDGIELAGSLRAVRQALRRMDR